MLYSGLLLMRFNNCIYEKIIEVYWITDSKDNYWILIMCQSLFSTSLIFGLQLHVFFLFVFSLELKVFHWFKWEYPSHDPTRRKGVLAGNASLMEFCWHWFTWHIGDTVYLTTSTIQPNVLCLIFNFFLSPQLQSI